MERPFLRGAGAAAVAAALALASCGGGPEGPPEIVLDRTTCSHCRMLVSEPAFAAAYRVDGVEPRVFDDVGCLLEALVEEERSPSLRVWFHDFESGSWIDAGEASFVSESEIETPMGGGIVAFADPVRAERTASSRNGRFVESFEALLASEMAKR